MKKRILGCIIAAVLVCGTMFSFTGCSSNESADAGKDTMVEKVEREYEVTKEETNATKEETENVTLKPENYSNQELAKTLLTSDSLRPSSVELLWRDMYPEHMNMAQGGHIVGKYFYQAYAQRDAISNELNNKCIIVKYDLETGEKLQTSDEYQLNHANDITYNSKLGYLVVCHNTPVMNCISYINLETLELVDTFGIETFIYSIDYNEKTDKYIVGLSGGQTFQILDSDFHPISEVFKPTAKTQGYTTQGCGSDDDFVYFILHKENVIAVYDWQGNFITVIDAGFTATLAEPESISVIDGEIYVGALSMGQSGLRIYKLSGYVPKLEETTN